MMFELLIPLALLAGADPAVVVKAVMEYERSFIERGGASPFVPEVLQRLFTEDFVDAYRAVEDLEVELRERLIVEDPITGREEYCPVHDVEIVAGPRTDDTAEVTASFGSRWCFGDADPAIAGQVIELVFTLAYESDEWRIDDFVHSDDGSYRAFLDSLLAE